MSRRLRAAGRPNVGKSTLVNAIVGRKVAIVSDKPQTTRRAIRGVLTTREFQLVLTDLPGVQRPRDALTARMQRRVESELAEADAALFVVNGEQGVGGGGTAGSPRRSAARPCPWRSRSTRSTASTTRARSRRCTSRASSCRRPRCSRSRRARAAACRRWSTSSPGCCPRARSTSRPRTSQTSPSSVMLAELVREQVLARTRQEVPHAVEVQVEEIEERDGLTPSARSCGWRPSPRRAS